MKQGVDMKIDAEKKVDNFFIRYPNFKRKYA